MMEIWQRLGRLKMSWDFAVLGSNGFVGAAISTGGHFTENKVLRTIDKFSCRTPV
jgi:hypothetical protein